MKSSQQTKGKPVLSRLGCGDDLIIYGPPGTGKTRRLVQEGQRHDGLVTFCSHARATARAGAQSLGVAPDGWSIGTIHSLCFRRLGLSRAQVVADHNLQAYCKLSGLYLESDEERPSELRFYMHCHSFARSTGQSHNDAYEQCGALGSRSEYEDFCSTYDQWRDHFGFMDYTDMLERAVKRGFEAPVGLLIIDEAQDLTPLHWKVIDKLRPVASRVVIAGDDDQAIYEWSGADPHGMKRFAEESGGRVEVLSQSYRVPQSVYEIAARISNRIENREPKKYAPRNELGQVARSTVLSKTLLRDLYKAGTVMMLFRNKYMRASYERLMLEARVPYTTERGTGPVQQRSGKAYMLMQQGRWHEPDDIRVIRSALTSYGITQAEAAGYQYIADLCIRGDSPCDVLKASSAVMGYLRGSKLDARPVDMRTIHSSKGLEADSVIVVSSLTKKSLESMYHNPDAEHRVHYVAVTRAKQRLVIIEENAAYDFPS